MLNEHIDTRKYYASYTLFTMNKNAILIEKFGHMKQNTCITLWWCSSSTLFSRVYEFIIIHQAKSVLFNCLFRIHYQSILTFNKSTYRQLIITCWDAPPLPPTIQFFKILNYTRECWASFSLENVWSLSHISSHITFQLNQGFQSCHINHASCYL